MYNSDLEKQIEDYKFLSVRGLLCISLTSFESFCEHKCLANEHLENYFNWMWGFLKESLQFQGSSWRFDEPELVSTALGYEFPEGFSSYLESRGGQQQMFRSYIENVTEILMSNLESIPNRERTFQFFTNVYSIAHGQNANIPSASLISDSDWDSHGGWGRILPDCEVENLRKRLRQRSSPDLA